MKETIDQPKAPATVEQAPQDPELRKLDEIVDSPRALRSLKLAGIRTLADVRQQGLAAIQSIRFVGEATVEQLALALGPDVVEEIRKDDEHPIEEGLHPLRLGSPYRGYKVKLLDSERVPRPGGGHSIQKPLYLEFIDGDAAFSKLQYLTVAHARDTVKIAEAMSDSRHRWRRDAAKFLATVEGHGRDFHVRSD